MPKEWPITDKYILTYIDKDKEGEEIPCTRSNGLTFKDYVILLATAVFATTEDFGVDIQLTMLALESVVEQMKKFPSVFEEDKPK